MSLESQKSSQVMFNCLILVKGFLNVNAQNTSMDIL